jgi:DNA-binding SARP family transcriptional activator
MDFRILGPLEISEAGRPLPVVGGRQRALLAILLLHANEPVSNDRLIEDLWGEQPPEGARKALQIHVSRLRKALGVEEGPVITRPNGYLVRVHPGELDLERFERLAAEGRRALARGDPERAAQRLREALALWRGGPLADFAFESFAQPEIRRLEELRLAALEDRIDADLARGRHAELVPEIEALVAAHPLSERLHRQLVLALYRAGRQADALAAYRAARTKLIEELGLDPTPELRQLEQAILTHDSALQPPAAAIVGPGEAAAAGIVGDRRPPLPPLLRARRAPAFVGRRRELEVLRRSFSDATAGRCQVVLLTGEPGIGKTSVAAELARRAHEDCGALVLYGAADEEPLIAYQPFVEALRDWVTRVSLEELRVRAEVVGADLARLIPELRERLPELPEPLDIDPDTGRYRLFRAVASLLGALSRSAPLVLVLDDLQWADESSLLLLKHVARSSTGAALLIVGACRDPDPRRADALADLIADLRRDRLLERLSLAGLSEEEVVALVAERGGDDAPARLGHLLHRQTEGSPFFIEEVWLHLADSELGPRPEAWVHALEGGQVGVPEGVQEVTARRLGRLDERSRGILERASVIGVEFDFDVLERLSDPPDARLGEALEEAVAAQLVRELPGAVGGYAFSHTLTRAALYEGVHSLRRARLHGRVGEALEEMHAADSEPHVGELAFHFLAAGRGAADKAVDYSRRAGDRASRQLAYAEAAGHYERALEALERAGRIDQPHAREILERLVESGDVLALVGELGRAERLLGRVAAAAAGHQRDLELHALIERGLVRFFIGTGTGVNEHARFAEEAIAELDALGHHSGLAGAWFLLGMVPWMRCRLAEAGRAFERARAHARAAGERRKEGQILEYLAASHLFGPTPVNEAIVRCERLLAEAAGRRSYEILFALAGLRAMRGEFGTARELLRRSERTMVELGLTLELARQGELGGMIELLAGNPVAAERELRPGFELLSEAGERGLLSSRAAELADVLYLQARYDEAERLTETTENLADAEDVHPQVRWRAVRAKALARRGALDQAEGLAREAVALSAETDSIDSLQAGSRMDLAEVLLLAGRAAEAVAPAEEARDLYERKENAVMAARARVLLSELAGGPTPPSAHPHRARPIGGQPAEAAATPRPPMRGDPRDGVRRRRWT